MYKAKGQLPNKDEARPSLGETLQAGSQAAIDKERAGEALLLVLKDEKRPARDRLACALALGRLRYTPAIPQLIQLIELGVADEEATRLRAQGPLSVFELFPCRQALLDFGELAVPALLAAYLKVNGCRERERAFESILLRANRRATRIYLQGLWLDSPDYASRITLQELLPQLLENEKNKE
jgi:hypothetical protein